MIGMICIWYGVLANIPEGWHLCDGTGGTPDLRDKFVIGAGDTYNPGDSGGSASHRHWLSDTMLVATQAERRMTNDAYNIHVRFHRHDIDGETLDGDNRPPFYALYYIQKL